VGAPGGVRVRPLVEADLPRLIEIDAEAFGADRGTVLRSLAARSSHFACVAESGRVAGYLLGRNGRLATQIGPVVAGDPGTAQALANHALQRIDGPVLVDALDRHLAFAAYLTAAGFGVERGYTRMTFGADTGFGDARRTVAIAGPELG
jgi:hypothetical protein